MNIYKLYKDVLISCKEIFSPEDIKSLKVEVGNIIERNDRKVTKDDFVSTMEVILIITNEIGLGRTSVKSCILRRLLENNMMSLEYINKNFSQNTFDIIQGLYDINRLYEKQNIINSDNFRKLLLSFAKDIRVQLIFLAEKLNMLRKAHLLNDKERISITEESEYIYIPLSHKLGLYNIKSEMEDLCLRYTQPIIYNEISKKLKDSKEERERYIEEFTKPIREEMTQKGLKFTLKYRTKTIASILNKMKKSQVEFEEIFDIFAVRFILDTKRDDEKSDCWKTYSIVSDIYKPNPHRLRDWISIPKSNGYESLHTTVLGHNERWIEVQIRTQRMDDIAEKGFAAHWKYKGGNSDSVIEKWLNELREVLESGNKEALDLLDDLKIDLKGQEVFVFTPKGDLFTLPFGATIIDFAYSIHTEVGNKCIGGIVNGKNETMRYILKSGDQVSVLTAANQSPNGDWLNFATTTKAKNRIRHVLNENVNKNADIGKESIIRKFKNWKFEFNDENINKIKQHFKYKYTIDLYSAIGSGKIDFKTIKSIILKPKEVYEPAEPKDVKVYKETSDYSDVLLIDKNVDNVDYKFSKCCNPIFGDDIVGFVSIGEGIKVHRKECKNLMELQRRYPYRIVNTQWVNEGGVYDANISIIGKDIDDNILSSITDLISKDKNVRIKSINISTEDGLILGNLILSVKDTKSLEYIMGRIKIIKGVSNVFRRDYAI